ncbi:MAG: alpha/beta hydrolase [Eubacteriales bacterium]|nr:alpha/beta hydrolase [Eubacteriales bacterium]
MIYKELNVYGYLGSKTGTVPGGRLLCWIPETPSVVSTSRRRPAVLILPGGAYRHTSPREAEPVALRFAVEGYAAFVLHYSCAPSRFPTALREAAMAMRCIREMADAYGIDPHMVAALGFSAGGHLCGSLGTLYDAAEVVDLGSPEQLRPDALALCYPVAVSWGDTHEESFENLTGGDAGLRQRLSLESLVRPDMPPVFLWHTRDDASVPCRNSLILAQALDAVGVDFALHVYRRGPHGLSTADAMAYPAQAVPEVSWDVPGWVRGAIRFFGEIGLKITDGGENV